MRKLSSIQMVCSRLVQCCVYKYDKYGNYDKATTGTLVMAICLLHFATQTSTLPCLSYTNITNFEGYYQFLCLTG